MVKRMFALETHEQAGISVLGVSAGSNFPFSADSASSGKSPSFGRK